MTKPSIICLMGPTACGKTQLAIELVQRYPCSIISVDSAMIYRGMDIGTAKPTAAEIALAPHRLIDIRDPAEAYSAGDFCQDALHEIRAIIQAGKVPLLVGGTMLYFHALQRGLATLPTANTEIRMQLEQEAAQHGWPTLHTRLASIDKEAAAKINPNDSQRIQRALEVFLLTGEPISHIQRQTKSTVADYQILNIALVPQDRKLLHQRIADRLHKMLAQGFIEEVQTLYQRGDLSSDIPSQRAVGYSQVWQYLMGSLTYPEMETSAIAATRQLAKRQLTWLKQWPELNILFTEDRSMWHKLDPMLQF